MQVVLNIYNTSIDLCVCAADEKKMDADVEKEMYAMASDIEFIVLDSVDTYKRVNYVGSIHFEIVREDIIDFYKFLFDLSLDYRPVLIQ